MIAGAFLCAVCLGLSGCGGEEEEKEIVLIEPPDGENPYQLREVSRKDVTAVTVIRCAYKEISETAVTAPAGGKKVEEVYVEAGDAVEKGQLLAVLEGGSCEDQIRELEYRIARNSLLLEYTDSDEAYDLSYQWWIYIYQSSSHDEDRHEAALERIRQNYRYQREDYQDAIYLDRLALENLEQEMERSRIYADMDGVVSYVKEGLEGSAAVEGETVFRLVDDSRCYFESMAGQGQYAGYFSAGEPVEIDVNSGLEPMVVKVLPYDMEHWGDRLSFVLMDGEREVKAGLTGNITVVTDVREQVLAVPQGAVKKADDGEYVYVLGEKNIPEVRWVETGLRGGGQVEITSGLEEGEYVIL